MVDVKQFNGIMDTDSPNENIGRGAVKMARNIRYRGDKGNLQIQNLEGNRLIPNNLPAGINECIGAFYDELKGRIIYCNYNSNSNHQIYILTLDDLTITPLIISGTNTDGDILNFTLDGKIFNMKMLYGDSEQGDTIYFNNSQNEPCQINIERTEAGTLGVLKRDFLEVIKYPANRPPYVIYGNDTGVSVNTLRKKLFKFKTRYIDYSNEKSVTSMQSELPLPINAQDTDIDTDPTKNCKISIVYETGDATVKKIELLGAVNEGDIYSDYFLIQTIDKSDLGLNDNDIALFEFYNNQAYSTIDPTESVQLFDLVPLEANALEFLNGNVPIYGGITEGFNLIPITSTVSSSVIAEKDTQLPYVFVGSQSGDSAFGTGDIHIILAGTVAIGYDFSFDTTNHTISYTAAVATTTDVINGLAAAAVVAGFTVVSSDANNLIINQTGESLQLVTREAPILSPTNSFAYNWNDKEAYGLVYFDKAGRTNGVITKETLSFQTDGYTETATVPNIPQLSMSINTRPPDWAYYYSIVKTKSLAKLKFLYWVTDSTYKATDTNDTAIAYIGIENLNTFIANNPNSKHLAYDFATGDRIRFIKLLSGTTYAGTIYADKDFEILGQVLSPVVNGVQRTGQFIKIALPTTSVSFDFGTSDFSNYQVEIYTPAQSVANSLNKYYEFGERYTIGDPTLSTRYHQGMVQNQTSNLSQPATFTFNKGDFYYRERNINVGAEYQYQIQTPYEQGIGRTTLGMNFISQTYSDANIIAQSSLNATLAGLNIATDTTRCFLNVTAGTYTFRMKGTITVSFNDFGENFAYYLINNNSDVVYLVPFQPVPQGPNTFSFDVTFTMTGAMRMFVLAYSEGDFHNSKTYSQTDIKITRELPFSVSIIDANYSDYFASAVNSLGRPFIEQPEASRVYNPVLLRWGLPDILNTNINQVSRFTTLNFDEIDLTKGDIEILSVQNRMLNIIQKRGCGWLGIYSKIIQDTTGKNTLITTDQIITQNTIRYLEGAYGIGGQKGSFVKSKNGYYFTDPIRGYQVRRSSDGLIPLNELYKGAYFIRNILTNYASPYLRVNGAESKILGYYDYLEEQYVVLCQEGSYNGDSIPNNMFSFNEDRNAYNCFYDYVPEWMICAQEITFTWKDGQIYKHDNTTDYGNFFGQQTSPSVTLVFNDKVAIKKTMEAIAYQSNGYWVADTNGDVLTSQKNPQTGFPQISSLITKDFDINEGIYYAALNRDANSMADARKALLEGDFLKGNWCQVKLTYNGNLFTFMYLPYLKYEESPRNL